MTQTHQTYRYVFGPVASRRLGLSLGVEIVPHKICTMDCTYCEVGETTNLTMERKDYAPIERIIEEVEARLREHPKIDYLTVTGSGEPTLHSGLGEIVRRLKSLRAAPVAVLTNGTLLGDPAVQADLLDADVVVPSLDVSTDDELRRVNRAHASLSVAGIVEGLVAFRDRYHGQIWLEVLLVGGVTDNDATVQRIADYARRIRPDRVHLNTVVRPPAVGGTRSVSAEEMTRFAAFFEPRAEVVAHAGPHRDTLAHEVTRDDVLELLRRRPCPLDELAAGLGIPRDKAFAIVKVLVDEGLVRERVQNGVKHYAAG